MIGFYGEMWEENLNENKQKPMRIHDGTLSHLVLQQTYLMEGVVGKTWVY